ncbi:hypothetical protein RIF29_25216 [Crotalaria pallida]|uniref:Uncharacterized protein n=1 Tax=Crotalaria pallida TaxID=3830 RepID=A0AAN9ENL4_CROPI
MTDLYGCGLDKYIIRFWISSTVRPAWVMVPERPVCFRLGLGGYGGDVDLLYLSSYQLLWLICLRGNNVLKIAKRHANSTISFAIPNVYSNVVIKAEIMVRLHSLSIFNLASEFLTASGSTLVLPSIFRTELLTLLLERPNSVGDL